MADLSNLESEIRDFVEAEVLHGSARVPITRDLHLIDAEIIDSLAIFALVEHLEQRYGFTVQPEDIVIGNFETLESIASLVELRRSGAAN